MKAYLVSLAAVAAVAALVGLFSGEEGKKSGMRLLTGLCVLIVVAFPIKDGLAALSDPDLSFLSLDTDDRTAEYESIFDANVGLSGGAYLAERISDLLARRYAVDASLFTVRLAFSPDGDRVEAVTVLLWGKAAFVDTYDLEAYVGSLCDCPVTTAVGRE